MGIADTLRAQSPQQTSERSDTFASRQEAVEDQIRQLTKAVNDLTDQQAIVEARQETRLERLQLLLEQPSTDTTADARTRRSLDTILELQRRIAESLEGESFRRELKNLTAAAQSLRTTATSVSASTDSALEELREDLSHLSRQARDTSRALDVGSRANAGAQRLHAAADRAEKVAARVDRVTRWSWALSGRLLAGGLLLLLTLGVVSGALWGLAALAGVPELSAAIWEAFTATDPWWGKTLWALTGVGFTAAVTWAAWWVLAWLVEALR